VLTPASEALTAESEVETLPNEVLTPVSEALTPDKDVETLFRDVLTFLTDVLATARLALRSQKSPLILASVAAL
jgi:hypothetical protein